MCFKVTQYEDKANPIYSKMNFRAFIKGGNFLTILATVSFWKSTEARGTGNLTNLHIYCRPKGV